MKVSEYIADFDSASAMMRAVGRYLEGKDFPQLGKLGPMFRPLVLVNKLPNALRKRVYIFGGWAEARKPEQISEVRAEDMAQWVTSHFPAEKYPGLVIGSSNGAATHLCAAMGMPFFPQTFLLPVRHEGKVDRDEPIDAMEFFKETAGVLLRNNPELQLHHMHDANQDELMIQTMGYFRVKRRQIGETWEKFLRERIEPGGTIYITECGLKWPVHQVADRHYFQHGAVGGLTPEECYEGSARVTEHLKKRRPDKTELEVPEPTGEAPEAEWGFVPELRDDIERIARECGYRVKRVVFHDPADLSPLVADFPRWWYRRRGIETSRLVAESFICLEPWLMLKTGSIPFWMVFNTENSAKELAKYIDESGPFDEIYTTLFSHGVDSIGLGRIEDWKKVLGQARQKSGFLGVDESNYPRDFATFIRYHTEFKKKITDRHPLPAQFAETELEEFLREHGGSYPVKWVESVKATKKKAA